MSFRTAERWLAETLGPRARRTAVALTNLRQRHLEEFAGGASDE